jgi:integrase
VKIWSAKVELVFSLIRSGVLSSDQIKEYVRQQIPSGHMKRREEDPKQLEQVIDAYMQEKVALGKWSEKTIVESRAQLGLFLRVAGNVYVKNIDRQLMVNYLETLKQLPAGMTLKPAYRGKTIAQILSMPDVKPMSATTVNKYLERAGALLIWCMRQEYIDRNPARGLSIAKSVKEDQERKAYSGTDLKKLMATLGPVTKSKPERFWVPLIAMYSGLRLNEICQLYVEDVKKVEGILCFDINDAKDKCIKVLSSKRLVPAHPRLLELGFEEYVGMHKADGSERLWPNLQGGRDGYGHAFSKWYGRFNRKHITQDPKKVFHSFRHTVADTLKQKGVPEGVIAEILGHANGSITTGRYGKRFRPGVLLEALKKLDY